MCAHRDKHSRDVTERAEEGNNQTSKRNTAETAWEWEKESASVQKAGAQRQKETTEELTEWKDTVERGKRELHRLRRDSTDTGERGTERDVSSKEGKRDEQATAVTTYIGS